MIKVEKIDIWGIEHAVRGMRNSFNSWDKSDSKFENGIDILGPNDLDLMKRLVKAGNEHRKFMRQIFVSLDITAPLYWWKEFDTYKVGVTANSCSTMHTIHAKEFELDDFSHEGLACLHGEDYIYASVLWVEIIALLNYFRNKYIETKDKTYWRQLIEILPSSYNQKRTITMSYENAYNIMSQRCYHKLDEWVDFCALIRKELPYFNELIFGEEGEANL